MEAEMDDLLFLSPGYQVCGVSSEFGRIQCG
jgi:hypothetical protein